MIPCLTAEKGRFFFHLINNLTLFKKRIRARKTNDFLPKRDIIVPIHVTFDYHSYQSQRESLYSITVVFSLDADSAYYIKGKYN